MELILNEERPEQALQRLQDLGVLPYIHPALTFNQIIADRFRRLREALRTREEPDAIERLYMGLWLYDLSPQAIENIHHRLRFRRETLRLLEDMVALRDITDILTAPDLRPSEFVRRVEKRTLGALFVVAVAEDNTLLWERYDRYVNVWQYVRPTVDGTYLREVLKLKPDPRFGRILRQLRDAWLDEEIHTAEEEARRLHALVEQEYGPRASEEYS